MSDFDTSEREIETKPLDHSHAVDVQRLIRACPPLSLHTPYTYAAILTTASGLSAGTFANGQLVGCVLTVSTVKRSAFVWQLGVLTDFRRRGLGTLLLEASAHASEAAGLTSIETTIAETNEASRAAFRRFAATSQYELNEVGTMIALDADENIVDHEVRYRLDPTNGDSPGNPKREP